MDEEYDVIVLGTGLKVCQFCSYPAVSQIMISIHANELKFHDFPIHHSSLQNANYVLLLCSCFFILQVEKTIQDKPDNQKYLAANMSEEMIFRTDTQKLSFSSGSLCLRKSIIGLVPPLLTIQITQELKTVSAMFCNLSSQRSQCH